MAQASSKASTAPPSEASSVEFATPSTTPPPTVAAPEKIESDSSKLKTFLGILRKFIGVSDIASVRFSLPAQLIEPIPNLEYWHYLDRPESFIAIGESDDELERMLEVLRFWFTKDLKYVKGRPCKPYNSALGEFFRCNWDIQDDEPPIAHVTQSAKTNEAPAKKPDGKTVRVSYLTEQTSHHPPVSAFYVDCPEKGISARGFDQISAKFTGTSIRVTPGQHNLGIFINISKRDNEEYNLTHPAASLGGLLRGTLSVSVSDQCFVTCKKTRLKAILHYLEEGWVGRAQNRVVGAIFRYDPDNDKVARLKDVPEKDILAKIDGCWQDKVYFNLVNPAGASSKKSSGASTSSDRPLLIDVNPLFPAPKEVPPLEQQLPNESRKFWSGVTEAINTRQYGQATKLKQELEERQREKAAKRKAENVEWKPRFFTENLKPIGKPDLNEVGKAALKGLEQGDYKLEAYDATG